MKLNSMKQAKISVILRLPVKSTEERCNQQTHCTADESDDLQPNPAQSIGKHHCKNNADDQ